MAETFTLGGDPSSIRASATLWGNFSTSASTASTDIKSVNTTEWVGDESEIYRGRMHKDLVPHLDVTAEAWGIVKTALHVYAGHLESLQSRMSTLSIQHAHQQTVVANARTGYEHAKAADKTHHDNRQRAQANLTDGETLPADTYFTQSGGALSRLTTAQNALNDLVTKAGAIRAENARYVRACCDEIGRAKKLRPVHPPGWRDKLKKWAGDRWNDVKSSVAWAAEHLGPILKTISAIAGLLSLIPGLGAIMGPIALATGAAALALDIMNKLLNGKGSWLQIGIDAVGLVPGAKFMTNGMKVAKLAKAGKSLDEASKGLTTARTSYLAARNSSGLAKAALGVEKGIGKGPATRVAKTLFNRQGIKAAEKAVTRSETNMANARSAWSAAGSKYRVAKNAFTDAEKFGAKHDRIWKVVDPVSGAAGTTMIGVKTYHDTGGDWRKTATVVGLGALGQKIPGASNKFNAVQSVVSNSAGTGYTAYDMATNPEKLKDPKSWVKLASGAVKTGTSVRTVTTYNTDGYHPGATGAVGSHERAAYARPAYTAPTHYTNANNAFSNAYNMMNSIDANAKLNKH